MPRERAKLSDKQERILVQAQLMGLTAQDMQQIGNRLVALKKEAEDRREVQEACEGYTWEPLMDAVNASKQRGWKVTTPDGYVVEAIRGSKGKSSWYETSWDYDIKVSKPGTRFKPRYHKTKSMRCNDSWRNKLMPGQSKELYAIIRWLKQYKWEMVTV